jgi:hypothetical protein
VKPAKTVGVYDRPPPKRWPKYVAIAVAVVIGIIVTILMMDRANAHASVSFLERGAHLGVLTLAQPDGAHDAAVGAAPNRSRSSVVFY